MICPYGCECKGDIIRKFDMVIHNYEEYTEEECSDVVAPTLDEELNEESVEDRPAFLKKKEDKK